MLNDEHEHADVRITFRRRPGGNACDLPARDPDGQPAPASDHDQNLSRTSSNDGRCCIAVLH